MSIFKCRRFPVKIILVCVRWYCKYGDHLPGLGGEDAGARRRGGRVNDLPAA